MQCQCQLAGATPWPLAAPQHSCMLRPSVNARVCVYAATAVSCDLRECIAAVQTSLCQISLSAVMGTAQKEVPHPQNEVGLPEVKPRSKRTTQGVTLACAVFAHPEGAMRHQWCALCLTYQLQWYLVLARPLCTL